ncbi:hypothetical protein Psuf_013190 [Phytohabitans suffuscus]|uniref:Major facilitator superfamily (MFS) profile domain-containing protein n=1 Tax=Phytohabitans suffuscus TaxID=624315 RepID=A0A6F8YD28_9ACTN|nr:MFS transporter [Phytohabitans suffuscus]BCB84006.1 hypothetical protein Psuf_013190 [Phytohabitans suffuscus]
MLCGALFLDGLDVSMVGVALPSIQADLGLSNSTLQWVVSGYVLGYGGLAVLFAGIRLIPPDGGPHAARPEKAERGYDLFGAATVTTALLLLVYTVVEAPSAGWLSARTVGSYVGFQFLGAQYTQVVLGWSPLAMAMAFLPGGLIVAFGGPRTARLVNRFGTGRVVAAGLVSFMAAYLLFLRIDGEPRYAGVILPTMLLLGLGFALAYPSLNIQATAGVADDEQGLASGLVQASFQVGGAIVLAGVTAVIATAEPARGTVPDSFYPAIWLVTATAAFGLAVTLLTLPRSRSRA